MAERIDEKILENVLILAKLEIPEKERADAIGQMQKMLDYVEKLQELDTSSTEPMIHPAKMENVFREDEESGEDWQGRLLGGAPEAQDGQFVVPRTVE